MLVNTLFFQFYINLLSVDIVTYCVVTRDNARKVQQRSYCWTDNIDKVLKDLHQKTTTPPKLLSHLFLILLVLLLKKMARQYKHTELGLIVV